jgi:ribA/ribD-fused uncharacterized protein
MTKEDIIREGFFGELRYLSNFHLCSITYEGITYPSSEHLYMAFKTTDNTIRQSIANISESKEVKKFGRTIDLRPNWDNIRVKMMYIAVSEKFKQNKNLADKLIDTGDLELVEHNWWRDKFWGKHFDEGENNLGKILMRVRKELKGEN